jgi:hypothetical protein
MPLATLPNVLTLAEASQYLRLSPESLVRQVELGNLPGQQVNEDWRFLRGRLMIGCAAAISGRCCWAMRVCLPMTRP